MAKTLRLVVAVVVFVCVGLCVVGDMYAKVLTIKSSKRFDRMLSKKPFAAVMFYHEQKKCCTMSPDREIEIDPQASMTAAQGVFQEVSEHRMYKEADLQFLRVNIADVSLEGLALELGVKKVPAWLLFRHGRVVRDKRDKKSTVSVLTGDVDYKQLRGFINTHLRNDLEDRLERKAEERERRSEGSASVVYFGYGYPGYYGYPYYGYGPGASVGFGFSI